MNAFIEEFISYLNLIHRLSASENAGITQNMVQCIDNHIRYKYLRQDEFVKLRTEMFQVDNLINIFRTRFGENLTYGKRVGENLPDPYLPSNTLLALVESTLVHGLIPKEGDWRLNIDIGETEQGLLIQVADNGICVASSRSDLSRSDSSRSDSSSTDSSSADSSNGNSFNSSLERKDSIAVVNSRLKEYYANTDMNPLSGLQISSDPVHITCSGTYNKVTILLPNSGF